MIRYHALVASPITDPGVLRPPSAPRIPFAERLRAGEWLVGTVLSSADPVLAERVASAFDYVWIDLEHSALTVRDAQTLIIAVQGTGASALVRLPEVDSELLQAVLDSGTDGVVAPRVSSAEAAASLTRALRFAPQGSRGFAPRRASRGKVLEAAPPACVVQIETRKALEDIHRIAGVDGIDALVVGTADLSLDLGDPLNLDSEAMREASQRVAAAAAARGLRWGLAAAGLPEWVRRSRAEGAATLTFASDLRLYSDAVERCADQLRVLPAAQFGG